MNSISVSFLYKIDFWPPETLLQIHEPFRHREKYPATKWLFQDFIGVRRLWVNVWNRNAKWTTGEVVRQWRNKDIYFEGERSPIGPFIPFGDRLVVEDWVLIISHDAFLEKIAMLKLEESKHKFMAGDNSVLRQSSLF